MIRSVLLGAAVLLVSCNADPSASLESQNKSDELSAAANGSVGSTSAATMSLVNTTWEFDDDGSPTVVTIDRAGGYVEERADGTHLDHGTYVQRDGKDCFTSAMGDRGTSCWSAVPPTQIGGTASATDDDGSSAVFRRVDYRPLDLAS